MNKQLLTDALGWGFVLWLIGYLLGMVLFPFVPLWALGWLILPFGILLTLWVLWRMITGKDIRYFLIISVVWTLVAVLFDYIFIVKALNPADGYYKLDVYLYYALTFMLPLVFGLRKADTDK